jgi:GDPmannose 4,6-dehydratase
MKKKVIVTGINGQDGHYLTELLIEKGYDVYGVIRRHAESESQDKRIAEFGDKVKTYYGDVTDKSSLLKIFTDVKPDEIYNLAAQSHVRISFDVPDYTLQTNGIGVLNMLETMKMVVPESRFYQASSSEIFGNCIEKDDSQNETTRKVPTSPYGCAKLLGFNLVHNYRNSFKLFASNGILFNHESILKNSPVIIKNKMEMIDILPIEDMFKGHYHEGLFEKYKTDHFVWNGENWTKIINGTCYMDFKKKTIAIQTTSSVYESTEDHVAFDEDNNEKETKKWKIKDKVFKVKYPEVCKSIGFDDKDFAYLIGYIVGDGYVSETGAIRLIGTNKDEILSVGNILIKKYGYEYKLSTNGPGNYENCTNDIWNLDIKNDSELGKWIRSNIYTKKSNEKKVPFFILNASKEIKQSFFDGYYLADGRKKGCERYGYKGYTTNSATLALGLNYIFSSFSKQKIRTKLDYRENKFRYYYTNFNTPTNTNKGIKKRKSDNEITKIYETESTDGFFFDIQTESQTFATGPNLFKIHNSPLRGTNFVTNKVVKTAVEIKKGLKQNLSLGNMDAQRDWGHSKDYVKAMNIILSLDKPDDFIVSTGVTHSVRELCKYTFSSLGMNYEDYVIVDPKFFRPEELNRLRGDSTKFRTLTGWKPEYTFETMIDEMIEHWDKTIK